MPQSCALSCRLIQFQSIRDVLESFPVVEWHNPEQTGLSRGKKTEIKKMKLS
jgi:hypothetical protein